jgi:CheY-like chemotaxis protein
VRRTLWLAGALWSRVPRRPYHGRGRDSGLTTLGKVGAKLDEDDVRALLTRMLESYGAEARAVVSAKEALELLSRSTPEGPFDVLLCDIGMPDEDGYSLVRRLRASPPERGGSVPAVALTAYGRAEDRASVAGTTDLADGGESRSGEHRRWLHSNSSRSGVRGRR